MEDPARTRPAARRLRLLVRLLLLAALLAAVHYGGRWAAGQAETQFLALQKSYGTAALYAVVGVYLVAMALPYVPGIEISLALLMIFGAQGVAVVYVSTLLALSASYGMGRLVPARLVARLFAWLHAERAAALVRRLEPLGAQERLRLLMASAPVRAVPFLLRHRYLAVAVAFNLPGNAVLGGGGGIALLAGMSGLFRFPAYVLMVCIAIAPIPLLILLGAGR
jgi:hypothetical protein